MLKSRQQRSRLIEILNVTPEGTPPVSIRLRPCWTAVLSSLRDEPIWFIWFVLFIWLVDFNQTNEADQINKKSS